MIAEAFSGFSLCCLTKIILLSNLSNDIYKVLPQISCRKRIFWNTC